MAAVTRLGLYGAARKPYASFAGKTPQTPAVSVVTRLGLHGGPRSPYASFAGKTPQTGGKTYTKTFTRLAQHGGARIPYGSFAGKTPQVVVVPAQTGGFIGKGRKRYYSVEIDKEIFVFTSVMEVEAFLAQVREEARTAAEQLVTSPEVPSIPRIRVKTGSGQPTKSKTVTEAVRKTRKAVSKAYDAAARRRSIDQEISELMLAKIEAERKEEENIIAILLAS